MYHPLVGRERKPAFLSHDTSCMQLCSMAYEKRDARAHDGD